MTPWVLLLMSIVMFTMGAFSLRATSLWLRLPLASLAMLLAVLSSSYVVADRFTGQGIDESVIYHLRFGVEGAGFQEYLGIMLIAGVLMMLSLLYGWGILHLSRRGGASVPRFARWLALPLLFLAWGVNPAARDLVTVGYQYVLADSQVKLPEFFVEPGRLELREGVERPRNLVLIYAESLERTYFDGGVFEELLPRLSARESEALSFSDITQLPGMGWTMGGQGRQSVWYAAGHDVRKRREIFIRKVSSRCTLPGRSSL